MPIVQLADYQNADIHETLDDLARRAREGRLLGIAFVIRTGSGRHRIGIAGSYVHRPADALAGATRLEYRLNELLDRADQIADTSHMPL